MKSSLDYAGSLDERIFSSSLINEAHAKDDIKVIPVETDKKKAARAPFSAPSPPLATSPPPPFSQDKAAKYYGERMM